MENWKVFSRSDGELSRGSGLGICCFMDLAGFCSSF
jgi:hypothetical protein